MYNGHWRMVQSYYIIIRYNKGYYYIYDYYIFFLKQF